MSGIRSITRRPNVVGSASASSAPIYVDSDDNRLKFIPGGSGSAEVVLQETSGSGAAAVVTATKVITAAESGRTFFLNSATEFASTLPLPALGLRFTFIVTAAPSGASYTVVTAGAAEIMLGSVHSAASAAGDTETTPGATTLTFVDGQSVAGDRADFESDGTNWYVHVFTAVDAGATFTG